MILLDPNTAYWAGIAIGAGTMLLMLGLLYWADA